MRVVLSIGQAEMRRRPFTYPLPSSAPKTNYPLGFSYSREDNPNRRMLEQCLAAMEGGKEALVISS